MNKLVTIKQKNIYVNVYDIKAKCIFDENIYKIVKENPHTLHFFCDISNIIFCEHDKCNKDKYGYTPSEQPIISVLAASDVDKLVIPILGSCV